MYSILVITKGRGQVTLPMLHGDAESVVAGELVVAAAGEQERLTVARVAPTQVAVKMLRGERTCCWNFEVLPFVVEGPIACPKQEKRESESF